MLGTPMDRYITGFEFHVKDNNNNRNSKSLKVDYLCNGSELYTETIIDVSDEDIAKLQEQLLDLVIVNLTIKDDWMHAKEISKRTKVLGVVNMFKIEILNKNEDSTLDIKIIFIKSGYRVTGSILKNVSKDRLEKITEYIADNTSYNLTCCSQCSAVTYLDLLAVIERKL